MTPEAQRIAIGEYLGYKFVPRRLRPNGEPFIWISELPDLKDLNFIHDIEEELDDAQKRPYVENVMLALELAHTDDFASLYDLLHASATARSESFLKVIGKYNDLK